MGTSTLRQAGDDRPASSVYWRRRFIALIVGLSILALVAWAFAGALGSSVAASTAASKKVHGALRRLSPSPAGTAAPQTSASQSSSVFQSTSPQPSASQGSAARASAPALPSPAVSGRHGPGACPAGDVVLSLFSTQASYLAHETPKFDVDVVSTDSVPCTFDLGARYVLLRISAGKSLVWTSADCVRGRASLVTKLHRGVPAVLPISWDRKLSSAGCPAPATPAPAGTYTAVATDGSGSSNVLAFSISRSARRTPARAH